MRNCSNIKGGNFVDENKIKHFILDDTIDIGKKPMRVSETDQKIIDKMDEEIRQGRFDA